MQVGRVNTFFVKTKNFLGEKEKTHGRVYFWSIAVVKRSCRGLSRGLHTDGRAGAVDQGCLPLPGMNSGRLA